MKILGEFKEFDLDGEETLMSIAAADQFNEWMYQQLVPYSSGKILEIGSGIGNISQFFVKKNAHFEMSDIRNQYLQVLKKKFPTNKTFELDLVANNFQNVYKDIIGSYDLVYALNVIEHIKEDQKAITNMYSLVKPGGYVFVLVPAYQTLFNQFDEALDHYRRYTKKTLNLIFPSDARFIKSWYFNFMGIFAWFLGGKLIRKNTIPKSNMKIYNFLTPLFKIIDYIFCNRIGLSVIAVYQKKH